MRVRVLGSNGWFSTSSASTVCTLLETAAYYIIFDAGEGIHKLGQFIRHPKPIYLFLSHFHLDHTYGFHVLSLFNFQAGLTIFGQLGTKKALAVLVNKPFSLPLTKLTMPVTVHELTDGWHQPPDTPFLLETKLLQHADPSYGYRLHLADKIVAYCLDTGYCDNLIRLASDADLFITECALAPGEKTNPAWPHLTPELAATAAKTARAKKLLLTHFSPRNYPTKQSRTAARVAAQTIFRPTVIARDGDEFSL